MHGTVRDVPAADGAAARESRHSSPEPNTDPRARPNFLRNSRTAVDSIETIDIETLIERYEVILLDAYGVLVNSEGPLPGAGALLDRLTFTGKPYYVLTNDATKPPQVAATRYRRFGLPITADRIISSGSLLVHYFRQHQLGQAACAVLGPEGSAYYVEQAGGRIVATAAAFDVLIVADQTGFPFLEGVDAALSSLIRRIDAGGSVHLLLPNPDLIYPSPAGFGITSGSVALILEAALRLRYPHRDDLRFITLGKPEPPLFAEAARRSGGSSMVMIGDQLATDIAGANAFGIDSALLLGGVSADNGQLHRLPHRPTYLLHSLLS